MSAKTDALKNELSQISAEYINEDNYSENALELFHADVLSCLKKYEIDGEEAETAMNSVEVRVLNYGENNAIYFSIDSKPDEIYEMISDTYNGDYGDETNEAIDKFLNELKDDIRQLEKDVGFDDPAGGVIYLQTWNAGEILDMNGAYWPEVNDDDPKPGE